MSNLIIKPQQLQEIIFEAILSWRHKLTNKELETMSTYHAMKAAAQKILEEHQEQSFNINEFVSCLEGLVALRKYKSQNGKDEYYTNGKAGLWKLAEDLTSNRGLRIISEPDPEPKNTKDSSNEINHVHFNIEEAAQVKETIKQDLEDTTDYKRLYSEQLAYSKQLEAGVAELKNELEAKGELNEKIGEENARLRKEFKNFEIDPDKYLSPQEEDEKMIGALLNYLIQEDLLKVKKVNDVITSEFLKIYRSKDEEN